MKNPTSIRGGLFRFALAMIGAAALGAAGYAADYNNTPSGTDTSVSSRDHDGGVWGNLSRGDRHFVKRAAEMNMEEIRLSELALQQSQNSQVRDFAQMIVNDHQKAGDELNGILSRKGVTLPADDKVEKAVRKLSDKKAKDFDEDYVTEMKRAHKDAIDLFDKEAKHAEDADLQAFASKTLPTLRQHEEHAKSLKDMLK